MIIKKLLRGFSLYIFLILIFFCNQGNSATILIDPGHGGDEPGAKKSLGGHLYYEKDLALQISQKIHDQLKKEKNLNVFLTHSYDRMLGLHDRTSMAERVGADLFISIHINSSLSSESRGYEIFYLDNHNDFGVRKVEEAENKSFAESMKSDDPIINKILLDLIIQKTVVKSKSLAFEIHNSIENKQSYFNYKYVDRGVKPGLLYVLALSKRPSVLIEVGFMSNMTELKKMLEGDFQLNFAKSVAEGIKTYLRENQIK